MELESVFMLKLRLGAGERVLLLEALAVLPEDSSSALAPMLVASNHL